MTELDYDLFASKWGQIGIYMQCVSDNLAINCDKLGERSVAIYATLCSESNQNLIHLNQKFRKSSTKFDAI